MSVLVVNLLQRSYVCYCQVYEMLIYTLLPESLLLPIWCGSHYRSTDWQTVFWFSYMGN